ncbi:hypothetical protein ACLQ2N_16390 [Streptomyces sp. DT224]|uniref:hypothetical protein n=1 Tax=Streptomyces sp. DT224 TaxID=3393426 RepID=UPI003CF54690
MKGLNWLSGGRDRELAATQYAGRESATDTAAAKRKAKEQKRRAKSTADAARAGQAWEDGDRRRYRG